MELGFFKKIFVVSLLMAAACTGRPQRSTSACESNSQCGGGTPYCAAGLCVQCVEDTNCGCHDTCSNNICVPLGVDDPAMAPHAHGGWGPGAPGSDNYQYLGNCFNDAGEPDNELCAALGGSFGALCNPFTGGCVDSAEYQATCDADDLDCPEGPGGVVLACSVELERCLPAAACQTTHQCCGDPTLACDPSSSICQTIANECEPPDEIEATCPFFPKNYNCAVLNRFCSPLGSCVQCMCDADCGDNQKCYAGGTCESLTYCEVQAECGEGLSCDTRAKECVETCETDEDCGNDALYCYFVDSVCRPLSELPCLADIYDTAGNNTAAEALANAVALPLPAVDASLDVNDLTACEGDEDWYTVLLNRGDRLAVSGTSLVGLSAQLRAFGPDAVTLFAQGSITTGTPSPAQFTVNYDGIYYLSVKRNSSSLPGGAYKLTLARSAVAACEDPFEGNSDVDNLPTTASALNNPMATGCSFDSTSGKDTTTCTDVFTMCVGDVDYYLVDAPAGSTIKVQLKQFLGNLDLHLFGPFTDSADAVADDEHLIDASTSQSSGAAETVDVQPRSDGYYLLRVSTKSTVSTQYDLVTEITQPGSLCTEDLFDAVLAATTPGTGTTPEAVEDEAGINDSSSGASLIALRTGDTILQGSSDEALTVCKGDEDWYRLGVYNSGTGQIDDLPAGRRVVLTINVAGSSPSNVITMAAGNAPTAMTLGSVSTTNPVTVLSLGITNGEAYYIRVRGSATATDRVDYRLNIIMETPPACDDDGLGDVGALSNQVPDTAQLLDSADGWPDASREEYRYPGALSLCGQDNDWYVYSVPEGVELVAKVYFDHTVAEIGLAVYNSSIVNLDSPPGVRLDTGVVAFSEATNRGFQRVRTEGGGVTYYLQVYNRTGWPSLDYRLEVQLEPLTCTDDTMEPNNDKTSPIVLPLARSTATPNTDFAFVDGLTVCGVGAANSDNYQFPLIAGDAVRAKVYYKTLEGNLDAKLYGPGPAFAEVDVDVDGPPADGILDIAYTVGANGVPGNYVLGIIPTTSTVFNNLYFMDVRVTRACVDDSWEPSNATTAYPLPNFPIVEEPLVLCNDEDWLSFTISGGASDVALCAAFEHDAGDIDLALYNATDTDTAIATSASKTDNESILTNLPNGTYYLQVKLDPRDAVAADYTLSADLGTSCP